MDRGLSEEGTEKDSVWTSMPTPPDLSEQHLRP